VLVVVVVVVPLRLERIHQDPEMVEMVVQVFYLPLPEPMYTMAAVVAAERATCLGFLDYMMRVLAQVLVELEVEQPEIEMEMEMMVQMDLVAEPVV
jgi:hypothetical protein